MIIRQKNRWDSSKLKISIIKIFVQSPLTQRSILKDLKIEKKNKKHKGVRRDTPGMSFESYAARIKNLRDDLNFERKDEKKIIQKRLQVKNTNMTMKSVNKVQFASLNDKRYYFSDGIVSLNFHINLFTEIYFQDVLQELTITVLNLRPDLMFIIRIT